MKCLPDDLIFLIYEYLPLKDRLSLGSASKRFREILFRLQYWNDVHLCMLSPRVSKFTDQSELSAFSSFLSRVAGRVSKVVWDGKLGYNSVLSRILQQNPAIRSLELLNCWQCFLRDDDDMSFLLSLQSLTTLTIDNWRRKEPHIIDIALNNQGLQNLDIHSYDNLDDSQLDDILKNLPDLRSLRIHGINITDAGLSSLPLCKSLQCLKIISARKLSRVATFKLAELGKLDDLMLQYATGFTQLDFVNFFTSTRSSNLTCLDLSGCSRIDNAVLVTLSQICMSSLKKLFLSKCCAFSDYGLLAISNCTHITSLDLSYCSGISDVGIAFIADKLLWIQYLDVSGTNLTDDGLSDVVSKLKLLDTLFMQNMHANFRSFLEHRDKFWAQLTIHIDNTLISLDFLVIQYHRLCGNLIISDYTRNIKIA